MHGLGFLVIAVIIGVAAGFLLGVQPSVNGQLSHAVEHPFQAALISFGSGTAILILLGGILGIFPPSFSKSPLELPWWIWSGGAIGVVMVSTSLYFVPKIGSLPWFAAVMTGQIVAAFVLDHFGLMGNPRASASPLRLLGASLMIASVLIVVYAKHHEVQPTAKPIDPNSGPVSRSD